MSKPGREPGVGYLTKMRNCDIEYVKLDSAEEALSHNYK